MPVNKNDFGAVFCNLFYDESILEQFQEFSTKYADVSDMEIYSQIDKLQAELSNEVKQMHIKNLDALANVEGFSEYNIAESVSEVKSLIKLDTKSNSSPLSEEEVWSQYVGGSSLLLWFLLVTALFRGRRGFRTPFRGPFRGPFRRPVRRPFRGPFRRY